MSESKLVAAFDAATRADLADLEECIAVARARLDSLLSLRRVLQAQFGIAKKRKGGGVNLTDKRRQDVLHYLARHGETKQGVLASELRIPEGTISHLLNHPWFTRGHKGARLSEEGQQANRGDAEC